MTKEGSLSYDVEKADSPMARRLDSRLLALDSRSRSDALDVRCWLFLTRIKHSWFLFNEFDADVTPWIGRQTFQWNLWMQNIFQSIRNELSIKVRTKLFAKMQRAGCRLSCWLWRVSYEPPHWIWLSNYWYRLMRFPLLLSISDCHVYEPLQRAPSRGRHITLMKITKALNAFG